MEELEQALRDYGMTNDKDIKEIISDVDSDNVSVISFFNNLKFKINQKHE